MKVAIVRRELGVALSMDVYADNLVTQLKAIHPDWDIVQIAPEPWSQDRNLWQSGTGVRKYYERLWRHPRAVRRLDADIFHIVDHSNAHVAYWLKKTGKPIVITCHDLVQFVYPDILKDRARFPALSMASWKYSVHGLKSADRVVAVSTNTARDVERTLDIPPALISIVPNGVEPYFQPLPATTDITAIRRRYDSSPETLCLLNVGSNHQRKNIPTILQVLVALQDRGINVKLWKVGDEFTPEQSAAIQSHNLASTIVQIAAPDKQTLLEIYNAADLLLAPSLYEGFGLTILEAMACGTPVISSDVSSLPEVAGDAAILVPPLDIEAIVNGIVSLQHDPILRQSYRDQGLARAKLFTWAQAAASISKIYQTLTV